MLICGHLKLWTYFLSTIHLILHVAKAIICIVVVEGKEGARVPLVRAMFWFASPFTSTQLSWGALWQVEVLDAPDGYIQGNFYASLINRQQCMAQLNPHGSLWSWNRSKTQRFVLLSSVLRFCTARPPRPPVRLTGSAEALLAWQDDDMVPRVS